MIRHVMMTALFLMTSAANALELGSGTLPIHVEPAKSISADEGDQIVVEGRIDGHEPLVVVLRIDDAESRDYAGRVNIERSLPPGPFQWATPLKGLRTSGGRVIAADAIVRMILFDAKSNRRVHVQRFAIDKAPKLPQGAVGYSLGKADAPLFAGFTRLNETAHEIETGKPAPVLRPGVDPLIGSGLRGVERVHLPWPKGRVRVSLWTEDVGEWENLPHPLQRRIRINGETIVEERKTAAQWIRDRYLRGRDAEVSDNLDPWALYGRHRGGLITTTLDVADDGIQLELAGDSPSATFLSAILIEPGDLRVALDQVEAERARWYRSIWRVDDTPDPRWADAPVLDLSAPGDLSPMRMVAAPDSGVALRFRLGSDKAQTIEAISLRWKAPTAPQPEAQVWVAQRRLERVATGSNLLEPRAAMLRGDIQRFPLQANTPRNYLVWINFPRGLAPGTYTAELVAKMQSGGERTIPLDIELLDVNLPPLAKPAGYYLDEAPQLTWFRENSSDRDAQNNCDLSFLSRFDITGNAPLLSTPFADRKNAFLADSLRALQNATKAPWLGYTPAKRLLARLGIEDSATMIKSVQRELAEMGLPAPIWSVADEPSNPGQDPSRLEAWVDALRKATPGVRLAGHLNTPRDIPLARLFDTVLINQGFGLDPWIMETLKNQGLDVWIYNTGQPRATAGLGLWLSDAQRYLQWHARMPTADPFDPTDGREGDVQIFPPMGTPCAALPDIHISMIEMAEGLVDQRWLLWAQNHRSPAAKRLVATLRARYLPKWHKRPGLSQSELDALRDQIVELARPLN